MFDYWTNTDLLTKWWPPAAELQAKTGVTYHYSWPKQDWHLRGKFTMFDKAKTLGFTWKWDHEPIDVTRVTIVFQPLPNGGTRLTLHHEGYSKNSEAKKIRDEHVEAGPSFFGSSKNKVSLGRAEDEEGDGRLKQVDTEKFRLARVERDRPRPRAPDA
jgi:uncharacterized protein YndB with AHSA1/START domain